MHRSQSQKKPDVPIQMFPSADEENVKKYVKKRRIHKGRLFLLVFVTASLIYFFLPTTSTVVVVSDDGEIKDEPEIAVVTVTKQPPEGDGLPAVNILTDAQEEFGINLYKSLLKSPKGKNLFFSPFSISTALAMTYLGARGDSAKQMEKVLRFDKVGLENVHPMFHIMNSELFNKEEENSYILKLANKLFGHLKYDFLAEFLSSCEAYYGAKLESLNFANSEGAREEINTWVEKQTEDKIKDLIPKGVIDDLTRLVLVNAIYFKGKWSQPFDPKNTKDVDFHLDEKKSIKTPMMHLKKKFKYFADDTLKCKILDMPYSGSNLSMVAILPDKLDGLASLEEQITEDVLQSWYKQLHSVEVEVSFPRLKIESSFSIKPQLQVLGMRDIFVAGLADLTGMAEVKELFVSDALHKAFVEITEEGTEAAAASAVIVALKSAILVQPTFHANHPFIFVIRDISTGALLFMGRIIDPSK